MENKRHIKVFTGQQFSFYDSLNEMYVFVAQKKQADDQ